MAGPDHPEYQDPDDSGAREDARSRQHLPAPGPRPPEDVEVEPNDRDTATHARVRTDDEWFPA